MEPLETVVETAAAPGTDLQLPAKGAALMEVSTGRLLYEQNAHEKLSPASITKIMSLLLIMEAIDQGKFDLQTVVTASDYACSMGGSQIWLEPGETMTVDELLKATCVASANDATVALAELVAGSEEGFVEQMNRRAQELGMQDTHFINCTGLDADGHLTSAFDVAVMSRALIQHELIKNYTTIWMDTLRGGQSSLVNTNKLVRFYPGATGLKTGTTSQAGSCLSATAQKDNMELVAVVLGCPSSNDRFNSARKLLDHGFANWTKVTVEVDPALLGDIPVKKGVRQTTPVKVEEMDSILVAKGRQGDLVQNVDILSEIEAPVYAGQQIGQIRLTLDEEEVGCVNILAAETVERLTFGRAVGRLLSALFTL
ncbi:MAG: D-alanyl-D-alanine carboxypeptidase [Clostridiales bacterium]|nr:D-alanyl-D-alanine carboxypeptidase [Clostridiales bacterium]